MGNFKNQLFSGIIWTAFQTVVNRGFKFIIKLILARILFPEDYGLIGMAAVFTSVIGVFSELGMGAALVQKKKEYLTKVHYHTAFWTGILWGIVIYLIVVFGIGPLASWFYEEPILEKIIPFLSLGVLLSPISLVHRTKLTRNLEFKKIAIISNIGNFVAGILALIIAFQGGGVWSLVANNVASSVIVLPIFIYSSKWRPLRQFSKKAFSEIFGFGVYTMGTAILIKIATQLDYLIVGKFLGARILGIYTLAFLLTSTVKAQVLQVVSSVLYPLFSQMQDDIEGLKKKYLKVQRMNSFFIIPLMFFVITFADQLIDIGFGDKWKDTPILLKILGLGVIFNMLTVSSNTLIRASGKPKLELNINIITILLIFAPLVIIGTYFYGIIGTSIAYVISNLISSFLILFFLRKYYKIKFKDTYLALKSSILIGLIPYLTVMISKEFSENLFINIGIFLSVLIMVILWLGKTELSYLQEIKKKSKISEKRI